MAQWMTSFVEEAWVPKAFVEQAQKCIQDKVIALRLREAQQEIKLVQVLLDTMAGLVAQRFVLMKQDVFLDVKTGLLLPRFDRFYAPLVTAGQFCKWWYWHKNGKNASKMKAALDFSGFAGRPLKKEELSVFVDTRFPYSHIHQDGALRQKDKSLEHVFFDDDK